MLYLMYNAIVHSCGFWPKSAFSFILVCVILHIFYLCTDVGFNSEVPINPNQRLLESSVWRTQLLPPDHVSSIYYVYTIVYEIIEIE